MDEALARHLVRAQFPQLRAHRVELVAAGWDYTVHRVDGWAFRFPRRAVVVEPMLRELDVLGVVAPRLPVAVPEPVHVGTPTEDIPGRSTAHAGSPASTPVQPRSPMPTAAHSRGRWRTLYAPSTRRSSSASSGACRSTSSPERT